MSGSVAGLEWASRWEGGRVSGWVGRCVSGSVSRWVVQSVELRTGDKKHFHSHVDYCTVFGETNTYYFGNW